MLFDHLAKFQGHLNKSLLNTLATLDRESKCFPVKPESRDLKKAPRTKNISIHMTLNSSLASYSILLLKITFNSISVYQLLNDYLLFIDINYYVLSYARSLLILKNNPTEVSIIIPQAYRYSERLRNLPKFMRPVRGRAKIQIKASITLKSSQFIFPLISF